MRLLLAPSRRTVERSAWFSTPNRTAQTKRRRSGTTGRRTKSLALFGLPFNDLIYQAQTIHRAHFDPNEVQISTLLSIKTGGCPEDCAYCPQSAHFKTGLKSQPLMPKEAVLAEARRAKAAGASRFCMGAAWRAPKDSEVERSRRDRRRGASRSGSRPVRRLAC